MDSTQIPALKLYEGPEKLVLGIDVGTTSSAVSLAHLAPGATPSVRTITSWPGAPNDSKLPSLVTFDSSGLPTAFGAECLGPLDEGQHLAEWWKLHLHPTAMQFETSATLAASLDTLSLDEPRQVVPDFEVPPLPPGVTIEGIYASFLGYLYKHTRAWFVEHTVGGEGIWAKLESGATIVCAVPDGWDELQQAILRRAFVRAGILGEGEGERLLFLREAEASVHFALKAGGVREWLKPGTNFTVVDAGGSTVDVCMYTCESLSPTLKLREVKLSDCVQAGGIFVDRAAETLLKSKLAGSLFAAPEIISSIIRIFEEKTKRKFTGAGETSIIKFGGSGENDAKVGVKLGRVTLSSGEVSSAFQFGVNEIIASVRQEIQLGDARSSNIILTGGFGQAVVARAVRANYGVTTLRDYDPLNLAHRGRSVFTEPDGRQMVSGCWATVIPKGTVMRTSEAMETYFCQLLSFKSTLSTFSTNVYIYEGADDDEPEWFEDHHGRRLPGFALQCTIDADLSQLSSSLSPFRRGTSSTQASENDIALGRAYWSLDFHLCVFLVETSLKAKIRWWEEDVLREGPASIVLADPIDRRADEIVRRKPADTLAWRA